MTGLDHEHTAAIDQARDWLLTGDRPIDKPVFRVLREQFGLTAVEAAQALAEAEKSRRDAIHARAS